MNRHLRLAKDVEDKDATRAGWPIARRNRQAKATPANYDAEQPALNMKLLAVHIANASSMSLMR